MSFDVVSSDDLLSSVVSDDFEVSSLLLEESDFPDVSDAVDELFDEVDELDELLEVSVD